MTNEHEKLLEVVRQKMLRIFGDTERMEMMLEPLMKLLLIEPERIKILQKECQDLMKGDENKEFLGLLATYGIGMAVQKFFGDKVR